MEHNKPRFIEINLTRDSNQDPKTWIGVFKGALCRAHRLCSNKSLLKKEINYLISNFEDNGYSRKILKNITRTYTPKKLTISKETNYKDRLRSSKTKVALKKDENKTKQRKSHIMGFYFLYSTFE